MRINVDVEATPQELRTFFSLEVMQRSFGKSFTPSAESPRKEERKEK